MVRTPQTPYSPRVRKPATRKPRASDSALTPTRKTVLTTVPRAACWRRERPRRSKRGSAAAQQDLEEGASRRQRCQRDPGGEGEQAGAAAQPGAARLRAADRVVEVWV